MILNLLIAIDQVFNVLVWLKSEGFGLPDETLSARAWRLRADSKMYRVINTLFFWQSNHCLDAFISEQQRKHLPAAYKQRGY